MGLVLTFSDFNYGYTGRAMSSVQVSNDTCLCVSAPEDEQS